MNRRGFISMLALVPLLVVAKPKFFLPPAGGWRADDFVPASGKNHFVMNWARAEGATGYSVYRNGKFYKRVKGNSLEIPYKPGESMIISVTSEAPQSTVLFLQGERS